MDQFFIAFITGLTTGGLSCLAVQGGLLATSLERQMEQDLLQNKNAPARKHGKALRKRVQPRAGFPIFLFLVAKLAAYTLFGFLLGALGSVLQLNTMTRAALLILIGIFMLGNGLRMLNVHPVFRYFVIEPPKFITRYIRRTAKDGTDFLTPLFLGALTVLIPCGVTQAMMAVAVGTGDPWQGAGIMFAFTLGASPVFFGVAYLATTIGGRLENLFMRFVAVVVLVLGLVSIDGGITLMGFPYSVTNLVQATFQTQPEAAVAVSTDEAATDLTLEARDNGYFPRKLIAKADVPVTLNVVTNETYSCSRAFVIPDLNVETVLPATGTVPINIPPHKAGYQMYFTCSMGMYTGVIEFR